MPWGNGSSLDSCAGMPYLLGTMRIVHVHIQVKPESLNAFLAATQLNVKASRLEPGIARFELFQSPEDPTRFLLLEIYRTEEAPAAHKETSHYLAWRDTVASMMAVPRSGQPWNVVSPGLQNV
jgi:quinol monooxygenase YgiN